MPDVTAWTTTRIPPTERTGRGRQVDGIMPAGGLTETTRQTTSADNPSSDAISFCSPIKWRLTVCIRYGYPKPTHQCGASGGRGGHARPAEGWRAEPAIAFGELVQPCATTLMRPSLGDRHHVASGHCFALLLEPARHHGGRLPRSGGWVWLVGGHRGDVA